MSLCPASTVRAKTSLLIAGRKGALRRASTTVSCFAMIKAVGVKRTAHELDRRHAMAQKQADRSPPVEVPSQSLERVERRDQDQSRDRSILRQICGGRRSDAEPYRNDGLTRLR